MHFLKKNDPCYASDDKISQTSKFRVKNKNCKYELERDKEERYYICKARHCCPAHFHKQLEIVYCNVGKQKVTVNNTGYVLKRNDILIISPYAIHSYEASWAKCTTVCVPTVFFSYYNKYFSSLSAENRVIRACKKSKNALKAIKLAKRSPDKNYYCSLAAILKILGELVDLGDFSPISDSSQNDLITVITNYIDDHYKEKIDLTSLSAHCHYSKAYLSQFFNEHFNCSFNDFVNIVRLNAFVELQNKNGGNFSDNAFEVGFQTTRTFYNVFKERYNMTPTEYFNNIK